MNGAASNYIAVLLCCCFVGAAAAATFQEKFDSPTIDPSWNRQASPGATIEIKNGWATFAAAAGGRSHLQRAGRDDCVCVTGAIARWAGIYIVWDANNWCGVGKISPTPFGRFFSIDVVGGKEREIDHRGIDFNTRHLVRVKLGVDYVAFQCELEGKWVDLRKIERPKEFTGAPKFIAAGKAYGDEDHPFDADATANASGESQSGAIDDLTVDITPPGERLLTDAQRDAIRHPPPEPVNALLSQNDDDPTFEKIAGFYPPFRFPREVVGVPEHPLEIGVDYLGRLDNSPWAPPKAWFLVGEKLTAFGDAKVPFKRRLLEGSLPLVTLSRDIDGVPHELTVFGWSEKFSVDADTYAYARVIAHGDEKQMALAWGDGDQHHIFPGAKCFLRFKWPEPKTVEAISETEFDAKFDETAAMWRKRLAAVERFDVPDARVMEAYRAWFAYSFINADTIKGYLEPHDGGGFYDSMFGNSVSLHAIMCDEYGLHDYAARILAMQCHYQHDDGLYVQDCGLVDAGGFIAGLAQHYNLTGDAGWLKTVAPNIVKQCEWILRQRKDAPKDGLLRGLIKFRPYNDYPTPVYNYLGNAWCAQGLKLAAAALKQIDAPQASQYAVEAEQYLKDIHDSMTASVFEHDGAKLLPMEPDTHRLLKLGKYGGGNYWGLVASPLLAIEMLPADDPLTTIIVDTMEKRGGLIAGVCEFDTGIDHAYTFGYLNNALKRDEVRKSLLGFWSFLALGMTRDTYSPVEVTMIETGENQFTLPHLYSCTEQLRLLRNLLVREDGNALWLAQGSPRAWLEKGKHLGVNHAATKFGDVSYRMEQRADGSVAIDLDPPMRRAPDEIRIRLRDPERRAITAVSGLDAATFSFAADTITLRQPKQKVQLTVQLGAGK